MRYHYAKPQTNVLLLYSLLLTTCVRVTSRVFCRWTMWCVLSCKIGDLYSTDPVNLELSVEFWCPSEPQPSSASMIGGGLAALSSVQPPQRQVIITSTYKVMGQNTRFLCRLFGRVDLIKWVSNVCASVCTFIHAYVRPSVHKKCLRFQWNLACS